MVSLSPQSASGSGAASRPSSPTPPATRNTSQLSQSQIAQIQKLAATDRSVRSHEQAHLAAAGPYSKGGAEYSFATGPDGHLYAVAGEVALDTSADPSDPRKTIEKARVIQAAANAPADPSAQDRAVAAMAVEMEASAQQELAARRRDIVDAAYNGRPPNSPGTLVSLIL
jgi:hypothetical protein